MRTMFLLAAPVGLALAGCMSAPVTPTAANSDACLQASVGRADPRILGTRYIQSSATTKCESLNATWGRVTRPQTSNQIGEGFADSSHRH